MNNIENSKDIYLIKWVRKDEKGKLIAFKTESQTILTEEELINHLESGGFSFTSITLTTIIVTEANGKKFVKTESNDTTKDNLDNLPLF